MCFTRLVQPSVTRGVDRFQNNWQPTRLKDPALREPLLRRALNLSEAARPLLLR